MSHEDEPHHANTREKLVRMANQIGAFFKSKPHDEGVAGVAEHINKFWEPRMRRQFFEMIDAGGAGFDPIVLEASATVRRPSEPPHQSANQGAPGGKGIAAGESKSEIASSQG
jgi:formate dehydrogenase subunit delta